MSALPTSHASTDVSSMACAGPGVRDQYRCATFADCANCDDDACRLSESRHRAEASKTFAVREARVSQRHAGCHGVHSVRRQR